MGKWLYQQATILYDPDTGVPVGFFGGDGKEYMCQFGDAVPISLGGTVDEYSLLPAAAAHALENWLVISTTGIWPFRKSAGLWRSNGTTWTLMMDYDELVNQINVNTANIATKQDQLVSTINIKSINGTSILGSGDLVVSGGGGISDGNKGDITVSSSGATWTIDSDVVTFAKIQNISTASFVGRVTAGTGDAEVLSVSQAKTLLNYTAADVGAAATSHTHTSLSITDFNTAADARVIAGITGKENTITAGTTAQYWRGDKSWQTLDKSTVGLANVDNTSDAAKNSAAATLTNKTISGASNTITNIAQSSITNLTTDLAAKQPLDADLTSLAAASATNVMYYRSAANTWSPVTIGANITFTGGTLSATGGGGGSGIAAAEYYARQTQFYYGDHL